MCETCMKGTPKVPLKTLKKTIAKIVMAIVIFPWTLLIGAIYLLLPFLDKLLHLFGICLGF